MCGVIGYVPLVDGSASGIAAQFERLFSESAVRGLHSFGLAQPGRAVVRALTLGDVVREFDARLPAIAHARYSTSGDWRDPQNNQPIVVGDLALAFNGVIHMGTKEEFERDFDVRCASYNDGEVFLRCLERGETPEMFLSRLTGSFAGAWLGRGRLRAARNERRPLWRCDMVDAVWYASTLDIFRRAGFPTATARPLQAGVVEVW